MHKRNPDGLFDVLVQSAEQIQLTDDESAEVVSKEDTRKEHSSLGLLALAYGNSSDSEEDEAEADVHPGSWETKNSDCLSCSVLVGDAAGSAGPEAASYFDFSNSAMDCANEIPLQSARPSMEQEPTRNRSEGRSQQSLDWPALPEENSFSYIESDSFGHQLKLQHGSSSCMPLAQKAETKMTNGLLPFDNRTLPFSARSDEESSRMHVFCLQHAVQVEKQLRSIGGARVLLLCHPDYPELEAQARKLAEELGNDHIWSDVSFREASGEDEEMIRLALESEEAIHGNGDWAVKLGINLYYSANLSRSPLYSKQMPYNFIIYNAFGRSPTMAEFNGKGPIKLKKTVVAGKWCGKVWMSNQVHPFLAERDHGEEKTRSSSHVKVTLKPERPSENIQTIETASRISISCRKRKSRTEIRPGTKENSLKAEEQEKASEDMSMECFLRQCKSNLRNKRMKKEKPEPLIKSARNKNELKIEIEDERKPRNKGVKNKKDFNMEIEDEPVPRPKCGKNKKELNIENEGEQKPSNKGVRSKRELKEDEDDDPKPPRTRCAREKKQINLDTIDDPDGGPSTRLRKRPSKPGKGQVARSVEAKPTLKKQQNSVQQNNGKPKKGIVGSKNSRTREEKADFPCDLEGCTMSFGSKQELSLHKRNICPVKGCGKDFISHKYLVQHRRVHLDDRPLKCPWKGCKMTFKWAWARTEHIRVHTGARPYVCTEAGCGQTFRFVSDFSRHKRKTGHTSKKGRG